jgi:hypothetical protein
MKACIYEKRMQGTNGYDPKPVRSTDLLRVRMLIIAASEADAEYYALHDLGFVIVSMTSLVSDCSLSRSGRKIHPSPFNAQTVHMDSQASDYACGLACRDSQLLVIRGFRNIYPHHTSRSMLLRSFDLWLGAVIARRHHEK